MPALPWTAPKPPPTADGPVTVMNSRLELRRLRDVPPFLAAALRILKPPGENMGLSRGSTLTLVIGRSPEVNRSGFCALDLMP